MTVARTLGRLQAANGDQRSGVIAAGQCSVVVHNALSAPVFILFGQGVPALGHYDLVVPGSALLAFPIPDDASAISAVVIYPGTVPAGDAGLHATILTTGNNQGTSVGPLA